MLSLIRDVRQEPGGEQVWISLTIGTWASPFRLLWGDSIWRDGPDVGGEGVGSQRERWLTFRDAALRRALQRGPLFPLVAFMQHGVVWSHSGETDDMWPSDRNDPLEDFCNEALSFFLSGTGLQELYLQLELMEARHWAALAAISSYARREAKVLRDAHAIGGYPVAGEPYGTAAFGQAGAGRDPARGVFWWRNPSKEQQHAAFTLGVILELPEDLVQPDAPCWDVQPLRLQSGCPAASHPQLAAAQDSDRTCGCLGSSSSAKL